MVFLSMVYVVFEVITMIKGCPFEHPCFIFVDLYDSSNSKNYCLLEFEMPLQDFDD